MATTDQLLTTIIKFARYVTTHIEAGHPRTDIRLRKDLASLRVAIDAVLGEEEDAEAQTLDELLEGQAAAAIVLSRIEYMGGALVPIAAKVDAIYRHLVPSRPGVWTINYRGISFTGRSPMGSSIQEGFGFDGTFTPADALGEPDTAALVAFTSDAPAVLTVKDGATAAAPFAFSADITAGAMAGQTANVVATVTDPDGNAVAVSYAVIVLAGDATGGQFTAGVQRKTV